MYPYTNDPIQLYLPLLTDPRLEVRQQACLIMIATYGPRALSALRRLLAHGEPRTRHQARLALIAVGEATDLVVKLEPFSGIYIQCLGQLRVYIGNQELSQHHWAQSHGRRAGWQKVRGVFAYLVHCGQRGATPPAIGAALWQKEVSQSSLTHTMQALRRMGLDDADQAFLEQALTITDEYCALNPQHYHSDVQLFEQAFSTAYTLEQNHGLEAAAQIYAQAMQLYGGMYMADITPGNSWALQRRQYLMNSFTLAAERLAEHAFNHNHFRQCVTICAQVLDIDNTADDVLVWQLRAFAAEGQRADLELAYRSYLKALRLDPLSSEGQQDQVVQLYQRLTASPRRLQLVNA